MTRTYADRREYNIQAVAKRRRKVKQMAVEYKGGKCELCGYDRYVGALDFHHLRDKEFSVSKSGNTYSWERVKAELDKCMLVCANCHRELTGGFRSTN